MDGTPFVFTDVEAFHKAVTAGYGTDVATLTGGGALRKQSLEPGLLRSIRKTGTSRSSTSSPRRTPVRPSTSTP